MEMEGDWLRSLRYLSDGFGLLVSMVGTDSLPEGRLDPAVAGCRTVVVLQLVSACW